MYGCESWIIKKAEHWRIDAFELWCWRRLLSPLECKEIQPVHPKGDWSWIFIGRTDAKAETPILWPPDKKNWLTGKDPDAEKDWRQEEGDDRGRDGWMASLTQWTWIWTSSGGWTELQRVGHDWVTELNWRGKQHRWRLYDSREYDLVPRNEVPVLMGVRQRGSVVRLGWEIPRD